MERRKYGRRHMGREVEVGHEHQTDCRKQKTRRAPITPSDAGSLDAQWAAVNAALERLGLAKLQSAHVVGRLLVALDLTASRAESLKQARVATARMFAAIKAVGKVAVKMLYFRGDECRATAWHDDADKISGAMLSLSCKTGNTQICRVLKLALAEKEKLSGVVLVGDHSEDNPDELCISRQRSAGARSPCSSSMRSSITITMRCRRGRYSSKWQS